MYADSKYQPSYIPVFCPRQSTLSRIHSQKMNIFLRRPNSFLAVTPSLPSKINSSHLSEYPNPRRRCSSEVIASGSLPHVSPHEEMSPVNIICTIIHGAFEKAVAELMFPSRHDETFLKCYELVGAVLYAKRNHISIKELECELHSFSHSEPGSTLPLMSELQRYTVRAFLARIYEVDDLLETRNHIGIAKYTPNINPRRVEYNRLRRIAKQERLVSEVLKEICQCNVGTLREMISEKPPEVVSRDSLPSRWADVLAVLTAYLREHVRLR